MAGNSSSHPTRSSSSSADMDDSTLQEVGRSGSINPAVNPVIQRDVTMLPITDDDAEEDDGDSTYVSHTDDTSAGGSTIGS